MCMCTLCCRHPFLLKLVTTFRDANKLYMLTDVVLGGELFSVLTRNDKLKPPPAKFYASCVVAAVEALHVGTCKVMNRDCGYDCDCDCL